MPLPGQIKSALILSVVAAVLEVAGGSLLFFGPATVVNSRAVTAYAMSVAPYLVALVAAVVGLAAGGSARGRWAHCFVLGSWFASFAAVVDDALEAADFHVFIAGLPRAAEDARVAALVIVTTADVAGVVVVLLLLAAFRKLVPRSRWAMPAVSVLLFAATVAGWVLWHVAQLMLDRFDLPPHASFWATFYPDVGWSIAGVLAAGLAAGYALGITARSAGGAVLIGWAVAVLFGLLPFVSLYTSAGVGWAGAGCAVVVVTMVLAIIYSRHKPAPVPGGSPAVPGPSNSWRS